MKSTSNKPKNVSGNCNDADCSKSRGNAGKDGPGVRTKGKLLTISIAKSGQEGLGGLDVGVEILPRNEKQGSRAEQMCSMFHKVKTEEQQEE